MLEIREWRQDKNKRKEDFLKETELKCPVRPGVEIPRMVVRKESSCSKPWKEEETSKTKHAFLHRRQASAFTAKKLLGPDSAFWEMPFCPL